MKRDADAAGHMLARKRRKRKALRRATIGVLIAFIGTSVPAQGLSKPGELIEPIVSKVKSLLGNAGTVQPPAVYGALDALSNDPRLPGLRRLQRTTRTQPEVRFEGSFPAYVSAEVPAEGSTAVQRAQSFLGTYADLYGQTSDRLRLKPERRSPVGDSPEVVVFQQTMDDVPVLGGQIAVFVDGESVLGTVGDLLADEPPVGSNPVVDSKEAEATARNFVGAPGAEIAGITQLVIVERDASASKRVGSDPRLAWRVAVGQNDTRFVLVDAMAGDVLFDYANDAYGFKLEIYDAAGKDKGGCNPAFNYPLIGDSSGLDAQYQNVADAQAALTESKAAYNFYWKRFKRDSYDADGSRFRSVINWASGGTVAMSTNCGGDFDTMLFDSGNVTRDIMTHELTHSVIRRSSDLTYLLESGALNESFADIMASVHDGNWTVGEGSSAGIFRSLQNPPTYGDPDRMSNFCASDAQCNFSGDAGGVHTNSGIHNKAAFLMAQGQLFNGVQVKGLGIEKLGYLMYLTMLHMPNVMFSGSFLAARDFAMNYAETWAKTQKFGFTVLDVCTVRNAYSATEIALDTADQDCDGQLDNADVDDDGDFAPDYKDNCLAVANPSQTNSDNDGLGDACDTNDDNDWDLDATDNCPTVPNYNQKDSDKDGVGDACQDTDHDGVLDNFEGVKDNCPNHYNDVQADLDNDGLGDACDPDADGDGIPNDDDNCAREYNPDQLDSDGGGIGDACDPTPFDRTDDDFKGFLIGLGSFSLGAKFEAALSLPVLIDLCQVGCPEGWLERGAKAQLSVRGLPDASKVWVSRMDGLTLALPDDTGQIKWSPTGDGKYVLNIQLGPDVQPGPGQVGVNTSWCPSGIC